MRKVLYHANCKDGFAAALVCWLKFGDENTEYKPVTYGRDSEFDGIVREIHPHDEVIIVDFSYSARQLRMIVDAGASLLVLDHHKTAEANCTGPEAQELGVDKFCRFDMTKSGCRMAWEHFFPMQMAPALILYVEDRDLWKFQYEETRKVCAGLDVLPQTFRIWEACLVDVRGLKQTGAGILTYNKGIIDNALRQVTFNKWLRLVREPIPCLNAMVLWSEIGEAMNRTFSTCSFSATYYAIRTSPGPTKEIAQGDLGPVNLGPVTERIVAGDERVKWKWSLRSQSGFDVSALARAFGGGGHAAAAGFVTDTIEEVIAPW